jgi:sugar phosphate isomerase/epimerase
VAKRGNAPTKAELEAIADTLEPGKRRQVGTGIYMTVDGSGRLRFQWRARLGGRRTRHAGGTCDSYEEAENARNRFLDRKEDPTEKRRERGRKMPIEALFAEYWWPHVETLEGNSQLDYGSAWEKDIYPYFKGLMTEAAEAGGITLAVESLNHFEHYLANTAAETAALCREVGNPRCGMVYDTFHAHIEEKDVRRAVEDCADVLTYVHLSENDRSTPGQGQVDWFTTFDALHGIGYDGWMTVEAFSATNPSLVAMLKVWRRGYVSEEHVVRDGVAFVRGTWSRRCSDERSR